MNMNTDLISRAEAKALFDDIPPYIGMTGGCVKSMIDGLPAVDAVPIPCKLGQTIYEVVLLRGGSVSHINPMTLVGVHVGNFPDHRGHKRKSYLVVVHPTSDILGRVPMDKIGKTVFTTLKDAEAFVSARRKCNEQE